MDVYATNWNEDDNTNTTAAPDGAPEGMAPSGVNNVLRAHQGAMKRFAVWSSPKTTAGSATAYTLSYTVAPGALVDGMTHLVQFHVANGIAATLNVNGLGAIPVYYHAAGAWRVAPPGLIDVDEIWRVAYHTSSGTYRLLDLRNRTGEVVPFAGSTAPAGALLCNGQAVSRTDYIGLFTVLSTTYGTGNGTSTFNLPDLRGRVAAGKDDMGGGAAGRLTNTTVSPNGVTLGAAGGGQINAAVTNVSGSTSGSLSVNVASFSMDGPSTNTTSNPGVGQNHGGENHIHNNIQSAGATSGSLFVSASGTSGAFSIVQPTMVLNYLIRI
ncbi:Microcystin-dependent protein [Rhodospirillales bacterium URHD0017]|nr:Microcystin-dependent protein [Rhodospirillales bacterium URHD0017]